MTLSARLWSDNAELAADVLAHPFVRGIGDGSLPRELFAAVRAELAERGPERGQSPSPQRNKSPCVFIQPRSRIHYMQ